MGQHKTKELIRRNRWWPKMNEDIIQYVQSCPEYWKNKVARDKSYGILQPLELAYSPWNSIATDFITDLPLNEGCDQLWVIIDRFTKIAHLIPLKKMNNKAEDLAEVFAREIWKLHSIPADIISDQDSRFTSKFGKSFLSILGIRPQMSTAFHPQTNGQTEQVIQSIETFLTSFVNIQQNTRSS
jgi:transposase InsO family protein